MSFGEPAPIKNEYPQSWEVVIQELECKGKTEYEEFSDLFSRILDIAADLLAIRKAIQGPPDNSETPFFEQINEELIRLAKERNSFGIAKYGIGLQPMNGRNSLNDCIEEVLDLIAYFKTFQLEQKISSGQQL